MTTNMSINNQFNNQIKEEISANQSYKNDIDIQSFPQKQLHISNQQSYSQHVPSNKNQIYFRETFKTSKRGSKQEGKQRMITSRNSQNKISSDAQNHSKNSKSLSGKQGNTSSKIQLSRMKKKIKHLQDKIEIIATQNHSDAKQTKFNQASKITEYSMQFKKKLNNSIMSGAVNITMNNFHPLKSKEAKSSQKLFYNYRQSEEKQSKGRYQQDLQESGIRQKAMNPQIDNEKQMLRPNFVQKSKFLAVNSQINNQYNPFKPQSDYDGDSTLKHQHPSNLPKICEQSRVVNNRHIARYQNPKKYPKRQKNSDFFPINSYSMNPHHQIINDLLTSKKPQKSLALKGFTKIKIQQQPLQSLNRQSNNKFKRFKTQELDRVSQSSIKTGKKIYQIAFGVRKVHIPDEVEDLKQKINIPSQKDRILQPIQLSQYIMQRNPTIQMTPQQLTQIGRNAYEDFDIIVTQHTDFKMVKYNNCILYSAPKLTDKHILWHYNGKFYFGDWVVSQASGSGEKKGEGIEYVPDKYIYKGQFFKNKRNGTGKIMYQNGNIYEGQWLDGEKHGNGKLFEKQSQGYYDGEWKNNKRDGYGLLIISDNQYYAGTFSSSIKHGFGTEKFSNGDQYRGEYYQNKFHGKGKYMWKNQSFYEGKFQYGKRNGFGIWRSARKGGQMYMGHYKEDKKEGQGKYVWENGSFFQGFYINDLKHGPGRLVDQNLKQTKGIWKNGKLIETDYVDSEDNYEIQDKNLSRKIVKQSKKFQSSGTFHPI